MSVAPWLCALAALTSLPRAQQPAAEVTVRLAAAEGSFTLVGAGGERHRGGGRESRLSVPAGDWALHFSPAAGAKPASLVLSLPVGSVADVGAGLAGELDRKAVPLLDEDFEGGLLTGWDAGGPGGHWRLVDGWLEHDAGTSTTSARHALLAGEPIWTDYHLEATVRSGGGQAGLLLRYQSAEDHYAVVLDASAGELRLERALGGDRLVLAAVPWTPDPSGTQRLACQAHGFRLQVWIDDASIIQELDGAHDHGRLGCFASADSRVAFDRILARPPLVPAPVLATVVTPGRCRVVGRAPGSVGLVAWTHFALDRPWPPGLRDRHGFGPFLVTEGQRPWFLGQGSSGEGFVRLLDPEGRMAAAFGWPRTPALHGQVVLVEVWLATPDGAEVRRSMPRARALLH